MDETNLEARLAEQEKKIDAIYTSVEKTRKYFLTIIWITVIAFVLPLLAMAFVIPSFISTYSDLLGGI